MPSEMLRYIKQDMKKREEDFRIREEIMGYREETPATFEDIYIHQSDSDDTCH